MYYEAALLETDPANLPRRIAEAHAAIVDRRKELHSDPFGEEHWALLSAQRFLHILEEEIPEQRRAA